MRGSGWGEYKFRAAKIDPTVTLPMKSFVCLCGVLAILLVGCAYEDVEVPLESSYVHGPAVVSVFPPELEQRIKLVELDGVKLGGGGGGVSAAWVEPGKHRFKVRVAKSGWGSTAQYDYVSLKASIGRGGTYHLEISRLTRLLQIRDVGTDRVVGVSRYRILW